MERLDAAPSMYGRSSGERDSRATRTGSASRSGEDEGDGWPPLAAPDGTHVPGAKQGRGARLARGIGDDAPARLVELLVKADARAVQDFVEAACAAGASLESIYLDLIVPSAVQLGVAWEEDRYMFSDITVAMLGLSQTLRHLGPRFRGEQACAPTGHRILLIPARREQHAFGVLMVADFFARAGWEVATSTFRGDEAVRCARDDWFDVIGLSAACTGHFEEMAADIRALREVSRNPAVGIMVGGAAFSGRADRVALVGADSAADDALVAPAVAGQLVAGRVCVD